MRTTHLTLLFGALILTTISCSIRNYDQPKPNEAGASELQLETSDRFRAAEPISNWWSKFDDPDLDTLMRRAMEYNNNVEIAVANISRTKAQLREAGFNLYPVADANAAYSLNVLSAKNGLPIINREVEIYDVSIDMSWQIDLFGRVSQAKKAAKATYQASIADLNGAYVSVAAEVAATYIQLRGLQQRLQVAQKNVETQRQTHELTQKLVQAGTRIELDSARSKTQLELTRATIPPLQAQIQSAINRLSVLTNEAPGSLNSWLQKPKPLPSLPETINMGNAEEMLKRRPDIYAAERNLASSVAEYNVAAADFFPQVEILGSVGYSAANFTDLFVPQALVGNIGPSISWSILDFGRVKARADAADALSEAEWARYRQTVLNALEEVSNAMSAFSQEEERQQRLLEAARNSSRAAELAKQRYKAGLTSFLDVLEAERTLLQTQDQLTLSNLAVANNLVDIYTALGGGWQIMANTNEPTQLSEVQ